MGDGHAGDGADDGEGDALGGRQMHTAYLRAELEKVHVYFGNSLLQTSTSDPQNSLHLARSIGPFPITLA